MFKTERESQEAWRHVASQAVFVSAFDGYKASDRIQPSVGLENQRPFFAAANGFAVELRIGQAVEHLGGEVGANSGDELQAALEIIAGVVVAGKSGGGAFQAGERLNRESERDAYFEYTKGRQT
jgi:hypothetical protein